MESRPYAMSQLPVSNEEQFTVAEQALVSTEVVTKLEIGFAAHKHRFKLHNSYRRKADRTFRNHGLAWNMHIT